MPKLDPSPLFAAFAPPVRVPAQLRRAITAAYRKPERECVTALLEQSRLGSRLDDEVRRTARDLVERLRRKSNAGGIDGFIHEYGLSTDEGVALMCLAEALLRIPDAATRDALIRDKISGGDWRSHLGGDRPLFVNAASWALAMTGKLVDPVDQAGLDAALLRLVGRVGEPVIRRGVSVAMRLIGEKFVTGETIEEALRRARPLEAAGFRYSYDMLGEAAATLADAERYHGAYEAAIHAIGRAAQRRGIHEAPGISIKLSALHPRYSRAQLDRVMDELLPRVTALAALASRHEIGFNIDAEEADRLELSLDLFESLAFDRELVGWNGLGLAVQAYGKRAPFVIDWIIDLARRSRRRIMVRLVKGAYWDTEIKRAQVDGLRDFPVYTRKVHTDVAYIACARKLLAAPDAVFPQFATHNAQTLSTIYHLAGPGYSPEQYEFQCLHGMGEPLYAEVVGAAKLGRSCRIYAPVGSHETLLAYLVRRLLENGANLSFVNRIANPAVTVDDLVASPVELVEAMALPGQPHEGIRTSDELFADRKNSAGMDLSNEEVLSDLSRAVLETATRTWHAAPMISGLEVERTSQPVLNPADRRDVVGTVAFALEQDALYAVRRAKPAAAEWAAVPVAARAAILHRAADVLQSRMPSLLGLIVREAGKTVPNAIAEVREAIDFLRYYSVQATGTLTGAASPLGPVVCISPWNFPLAIFIGQIAAALAAGNSVLAKPAEETPLIAAEGVRLLHEAGIPAPVLQFVCGDGRIGAALVGAPETAGVMFTGSAEVARSIQRQLAERLGEAGKPIPLIAETGGQNAMIADSSALTEQVVADVVASAFDSAGQRCSTLRILCLQEDVADRTLAMLKGALRELRIGRPDRLAVDVGPVITAAARDGILAHLEDMRRCGLRIDQQPLPWEAMHGYFVAPAIVELDRIERLEREVFGPVLHVVRFRSGELGNLIDRINATGYGLTFGLHTRLEETVDFVNRRVGAGNVYINRNIIGAVVGVQPFGGHGLSGTGPKAGGPLYLRRLLRDPIGTSVLAGGRIDPAAGDLAAWLESRGEGDLAGLVRAIAERSPLGPDLELPGPVGERNIYALRPRGVVCCRFRSRQGLFSQLAAALATGNRARFDQLPAELVTVPASVRSRLVTEGEPDAVLVEGEDTDVLAATGEMARRPGPIVLVQAARPGDTSSAAAWALDLLVREYSICINTAAAGGNATLMTLN